MDIFYQLIQSTYVYLSILLIVALGGLLAERSGVTNIALEGIMIFGAFVGIFAVKTLTICIIMCIQNYCYKFKLHHVCHLIKYVHGVNMYYK